MPIEFMKSVATLKGVCTVEEAEPLLQWLQDQQRAKVKLKECTHIHTAVLQVLMAAKVMVTLPPEDPDLAKWLIPALRDARIPIVSPGEQ
jgi:hypothetical protein